MKDKRITRLVTQVYYEDGTGFTGYWGPKDSLDAVDIVELQTGQTLIIAPPASVIQEHAPIELPDFLPVLPYGFEWHYDRENKQYQLRKHLHGEWVRLDYLGAATVHSIEHRKSSILRLLMQYVYIDGLEPTARYCAHRPADGMPMSESCVEPTCVKYFDPDSKDIPHLHRVEDGAVIPSHGESDDLRDTHVDEADEGAVRNELGLPAPHRTRLEGCYSGQCSMDDKCVVEQCQHYGLIVP